MAVQGYAPPIVMKGLVKILDEIDKAYLAHFPGNMLLDTTLTKECMEAAYVYNTEQAIIASILVMHSPGVVLPLPGMTFTSLLPTLCSEVLQGSRRGDPISVTSLLPWLLEHSAPQRVEWYETCSLAEPEFMVLVEHAKKLPPTS